MQVHDRLRAVRALVAVFVIGLAISGLTAIPLIAELDAILALVGNRESPIVAWMAVVREALVATDSRYPFLAYGTDWLAFGHFAIAVAFFGAWRDPVRNIWLFEFGMIVCLMVLPYALIFGALREIPLYWRFIDCAFGVIGFIPLWLSRRLVREIESATAL